MPLEHRLCESIKNIAFASIGYFDIGTLLHFVTGFVVGAMTSTLFCQLML